MWKNPRRVEMLKSLPCRQNRQKPNKTLQRESERELFLALTLEIFTTNASRYLTADAGSVTPLIAHR
jgi:hypothetical protein